MRHEFLSFITFFTVGRIMLSFSVRNNYKRLMSVSEDEETKCLKSIQGIRFYSTALVIMAHVAMVSVALPVVNPKFNEDVN